ncbi:MAG: glycosyltransferase family 2 protein [Bacteroidetes bacterium]|nr:glycosyltransferase family 2 protein [Bacteroidota bacterium]
MAEITKNISIIVPCYNTAPEFISEAIDSVKKYKGKYSYDIIIVDDGSTHPSTLVFLENINDAGIRVIKQNNKGLAGARNTGIANTQSEYLLSLDSDDRIKPEFIDRGINALKENDGAGVAYSNADAFGDGSRTNFTALPFDITTLLLQNHVPSCAVMCRKAWEDAGGFDESLRKYEDWEFWIRVYKAGWKFHYIKEPMFDYRIHQDSLLGDSSDKDFREAVAYIFGKHWDLVYQLYHQLYATRVIYHNDMNRPFRSFLKYLRHKV